MPVGVFDKLCDPVVLWRAYLSYRSGKRRRPAVSHFDLDADRAVIELARQLREGVYLPGSMHVRIIRDPKVRAIAIAPLQDRVLHHALVTLVGPTFERSLIYDSYAWGQKRGPHRAVLRHLGFARKCAFRLMLDIRRYFLSIHHNTLFDLMFRRIREPRLRALVETIVRQGALVYQHPLAKEALGLLNEPVLPGVGLAIGTHFSQWAASLYLDGLDHYVKRELKVQYYLRYMDDLLLFSDDSEQLIEWRHRLIDWLSAHRVLRLKNPNACPVSTRASVTSLGYRVSASGIRPGAKLRRRLSFNLRRASRRGAAALRRTWASYRGFFRL